MYAHVNAQTHNYPYSMQRTSTATSSQNWWWLLLGAIILAVLPVVLLAGAAFYYKLTQRILPGVHSGAVQFSNQPIDRAAEQLDLFWNHSPHFVLKVAGQIRAVTPASLGLWVDPGATAMQAYQVGRNQGGIRQLIHLVRGSAYDITPVVRFDAQLARDALTDLSRTANQPAQEAQIVRKADGTWELSAGKPGFSLDVNAVVSKISENPEAVLMSGLLELPLVSTSAQTSDLAGELERIQSYYQQPLLLEAYDVILNEQITWQVPQELVSTWIQLDDPRAQPSLQVPEQQFTDYLQEWQQGIGHREIESLEDLSVLPQRWKEGKPFQLTLRHKPGSYTVQPGDNLVSIAFKVGIPYWKIQQANPGSSIIGVGPGQVLTIPSPNEMLTLPVIKGKRVVISISQQHMWIYENGGLRSEHVISTGMDKSPTMPGVFQIQTHELNAYASNWDLWMPHFMGIYEAVPGFMNGIHGLPLLSNGNRLWGNVLGSKASYGCIIMDLQAAEDLYNWAENGVVVEIQP